MTHRFKHKIEENPLWEIFMENRGVNDLRDDISYGVYRAYHPVSMWIYTTIHSQGNKKPG